MNLDEGLAKTERMNGREWTVRENWDKMFFGLHNNRSLVQLIVQSLSIFDSSTILVF